MLWTFFISGLSIDTITKIFNNSCVYFYKIITLTSPKIQTCTEDFMQLVIKKYAEIIHYTGYKNVEIKY